MKITIFVDSDLTKMSKSAEYTFVYWVPSISTKVPMKVIEPPYPDDFDYSVVWNEFDRLKAMFPDMFMRVEKSDGSD